MTAAFILILLVTSAARPAATSIEFADERACREAAAAPNPMWHPSPDTGQESPAGTQQEDRMIDIGKIVHDYASEYEHRDPDYTPTEAERAMLEDFGNGLLERIEAAQRQLSE